MKYIVAVLLFSSVNMVGCDPMRRIDMKNKSGQDVEITWKLKDLDSLYKSPFFISNSKTVKFNLKPSKPYNRANMSFGIGTWTPAFLTEITDRLEALEILSQSDTIKLKSSEEINSFLSTRRKGIGKRRIEILVSK